jgi:hypothetical protein
VPFSWHSLRFYLNITQTKQATGIFSFPVWFKKQKNTVYLYIPFALFSASKPNQKNWKTTLLIVFSDFVLNLNIKRTNHTQMYLLIPFALFPFQNQIRKTKKWLCYRNCFFWFCFKLEYSKNEPYTDLHGLNRRRNCCCVWNWRKGSSFYCTVPVWVPDVFGCQIGSGSCAYRWRIDTSQRTKPGSVVYKRCSFDFIERKPVLSHVLETRLKALMNAFFYFPIC